VALLNFWLGHRVEFLAMLAQHLVLVAMSTGIAVAIGIPLGIVAAHRPRIGAPLIGLANVAQTIPSLALFGFLLPLPLVGGIGARTAIVALVLYALLPVLRTTAAGIAGIDRVVIEAGVALGMTPRQLLMQVELPLALPSIIAGVRVATVAGVGAATIAAAIGAGGLGEYIFRGLAMVDATVILAGAVPAALLAIAADAALGWIERRLRARGARRRRGLVPAIAVFALAIAAAVIASAGRSDRVVVGSKNFTEQVILGEILAQVLEHAGLTVDRRLNLGGTFICEQALRAGEIDAYVEYTGTALTAIFHEPVVTDPAAALTRVRELYAASGRTLLSPLGFNNTFAILVRGEAARSLGLRTIGDVAPHSPSWHAGFGYEFLERADGYPGLARVYGLRFAAAPRVMDLSLIYRALAERQVDLIAGDATNGLIDALDLVMLTDDRRYFPPYDAVPVVRTASVLRRPAIGAALERLAGRIDARAMRAMNYAVDGRHEDVAAVVRTFLKSVLD
jgi:osmoprotectant transport system substrate-binding protein/osmoprotectant transport system permease protein